MNSIRVLHTSDWHLGRKLFKKDRTNEGEFFLNWLYDALVENNIDLLLIAGDIFDVYNPPHHSIQAFYRFLKRLENLDLKVVIISGNHDSQTLIQTGSIILDPNQFIFKTKLEKKFSENIVTLKIKNRNVHIKTLPYFRNYELYEFNKENGIDDIQDTQSIESYLKDNSYSQSEDINLFMGHHGFGEFAGSGSEQAISLSGLSSVPIDWIRDFDYCALGHIHKYQNLTKDHKISYCGSPYQMRFSESNKKYVNLIEFKETNVAEISKVQIDLARELIQIKTDLKNYEKDIKEKIEKSTSKLAPFIEVLIKMDEPSSNLADEIRTLCNNQGATLLSFSPIFKHALNDESEETEVSLKKLNMVEMLDEFHKQKFDNQPIQDDLIVKFNELMESINNEAP